MRQKSKPKPARKAARAATAAGKPKAKPRSATATVKARTKTAPARKPAQVKKAPAGKAGATRSRIGASRRPRSPAPSTLEIEAVNADFAAEPGPSEIAPPAERAPGAAETGVSARPAARRNMHAEMPSESGEMPARANKLVPTNAVHTTKRRMKRNTWQSPALGLTAVAAVLAILVLGHERAPPDMPLLERQATARPGQVGPPIADPVQAAPDRVWQAPVQAARPAVPQWSTESGRPGASRPEGSAHGLKVLDLVELERMLGRLEMSPSQADGIVDGQTESAIRMYQQIAGLPIDGEPSVELLDDMREVVKMLDGAN